MAWWVVCRSTPRIQTGEPQAAKVEHTNLITTPAGRPWEHYLLVHRSWKISFFFFLRKISPELTTANPPLFAEEDWPWANIHAHPPLLYTWDAYHIMAFAKRCHIRTWDPNWRTPGRQEAERVNLTAAPPGRPPFLFSRFLGFTYTSH